MDKAGDKASPGGEANRDIPPPPGWFDLFEDEPDQATAAWEELIARKPWKASRLKAVFDPRTAGGPGKPWKPQPGRPRTVRVEREVSVDVPPLHQRQGEPGPRDTVVGCRIDANDLEAIDLLIEAGIRATRSEAAAWFIREGIKAQRDLLDDTRGTVAEIRRLREHAQAKAREHTGEGATGDA
jgi:Arc/MetJ-type ribon-helix-helix transcriptional regulator